MADQGYGLRAKKAIGNPVWSIGQTDCLRHGFKLTEESLRSDPDEWTGKQTDSAAQTYAAFAWIKNTNSLIQSGPAQIGGWTDRQL